jgi:FAD dependent oxidoreductase TIGR03364
MERYDVAVIGAGIVGLAHALAAARRGKRVTVIERSPRASGASIRNFGMVWPIGQPPGPRLRRALRSREVWLELARGAGFAAEKCGAMHVAQHADELVVLEQFVQTYQDAGYGARMMSGEDACAACPGLRRGRILGAMRTDRELCVDPREAIRTIPRHLESVHRVQFRFQTAAKHIEPGLIVLADGHTLRAERIIVCSGPEMELLFPDALRDAGIVKCKLQMMRTAPQPPEWRIGSHIAAGLTLLHYPAFAACPGLPALRGRLEAEFAEHLHVGIHVMVSQNSSGELVIGDSHQYGEAIEPFDDERIDRLILDYLGEFFQSPRPEIAQRWHGIYAKSTNGASEFVARPLPGIFVVNGLGGMGMTLSLGLAEETIESILADRAWTSPEATER